MNDPFSLFLPSIKDLAEQGLAKSIEDCSEDLEKLADGEPGQAIANTLAPGLASTETGDVIQDNLGNAVDNAINLFQGEPVELSIDPNFVPDAAEAVVDDVVDIASEVTENFLNGLF